MSELFVVGISWRTAPVAVREKLAFRDEEVSPALQSMTAALPRWPYSTSATEPGGSPRWVARNARTASVGSTPGRATP